MAVSDKNIVITPNSGSATEDPTIVFSAADATTAAQNITLKAYPTANGTLSFDGSAGQLFSITNSLSGTIFSVNDVSGIPSIEVLDTGTIKFAQYSGNVGIGTSSPAYKLDVVGTANVTSLLTSSIVSSNTDITLSAANTGIPKLAVANGVVFTATGHPLSTGGSIVNYPRAFGGQTGYAVGMMAQGSDTDVLIALSSKGTRPIEFWTNSVTVKQFVVSHTASAVNYIQATGAATGNTPTLSAQGSDTNIGLLFQTKGTGSHQFASGTSSAFVVNSQSTNVNYGIFTSTSTGTSPLLQVTGSDTDVDFRLRTQGTGAYQFDTGSNNNTQFKIANFASATSYIQVAGGINGGAAKLGVEGTGSTELHQSSLGLAAIKFFTRGYSTEQFRVADTASAVNYVQVTGAATGFQPVISVQGSDTNNGIAFSAKGSGRFDFYSGGLGGRNFSISHTASAVNYVQATGAATGSGPTLSARGTDTNIDFNITTKGSGSVNFKTGTNSNTQFSVANVDSAVNYIQANGAATANWPTLLATGSDTNVTFNFVTKGTGVHNFGTGGVESNSQLRVSHIASAVNYVDIIGNTTTNAPAISAQGSDAAINLVLAPKNGYLNVYSNNGSQFRVTPVASAVNFLQATGATANSEPILSAQGSDTDIALVLQSKGAGAIDLATGSGGVNVSNGTTVTAITRSAAGSAYTSIPSVVISVPTTSGGVQATANATMSLYGISVSFGGSGYVVGDQLTFSGGTGTPVVLTVATLSGSAVATVTVNTSSWGNYSSLPSSPVSVTGGSGSGATFNVTWQVLGFTITNAGSGYIEQPTVTFSGGGGAGATAYATIGTGTRINTLGTTLDFYTPAGLMARVLNNSGNSIVKSISPSGYAAFQIDAASGANAYVFGYSGASETGRITFEPGNAIVFATSSSATTQFKVTNTTSAVNYVQVTGAATNNPVAISAQGSDSNVRFNISSKGTESVDILTNNTGTRAAKFTYTASSVNWVQMTGAVAGASPSYAVAGADADIGLDLITKGAGSVKIKTGSSSNTQVQIDDATTTGQYTLFSRDNLNNIQKIGAMGSANFGLYATGGGSVRFYTSSSVSDEQFRVSHTASPVNYIQATGSTTGNSPVLSAQGSDVNIGLVIQSKGVSPLHLQTINSDVRIGPNGLRSFSIYSVGSAVNYGKWTNSVTGFSPVLSVDGTDTDIDLSLAPKGAGSVKTAAKLVAGLISGGTF